MELDGYLMILCHCINLVALLIALPPYLIYKLVSFIIKSFTREDVAGKVVLITGASSGIGEHLAYEYAKRGARLVLVARRENLLRQVAKKAQELGSPDVMITCADVSNVDHCKRFIEEAINHFGQLDHLVNNAGVTANFFFEETTNIATMNSLMDVNFWGSVYPTHFAIPHLRRSKGKIVVNSSIAGWFTNPTISIYGASKAALINFYDTLRAELGSSINITIVCAGFVDSEMTRGKHISKDGAMEVDQVKIAAMIGKFPIRSAPDSAKVIVDGVCRGEKNITEPSWARVLFPWKVLFPDLIDWLCQHWYDSSEMISSENGTKKLS